MFSIKYFSAIFVKDIFFLTSSLGTPKFSILLKPIQSNTLSNIKSVPLTWYYLYKIKTDWFFLALFIVFAASYPNRSIFCWRFRFSFNIHCLPSSTNLFIAHGSELISIVICSKYFPFCLSATTITRCSWSV